MPDSGRDDSSLVGAAEQAERDYQLFTPEDARLTRENLCLWMPNTMLNRDVYDRTAVDSIIKCLKPTMALTLEEREAILQWSEMATLKGRRLNINWCRHQIR